MCKTSHRYKTICTKRMFDMAEQTNTGETICLVEVWGMVLMAKTWQADSSSLYISDGAHVLRRGPLDLREPKWPKGVRLDSDSHTYYNMHNGPLRRLSCLN